MKDFNQIKMKNKKEQTNEKTEVKEESLQPIEYKTEEYKRQPLYTLVYATTKKGRPISYQRIYSIGYEQIKLIAGVVQEYYGYGGPGNNGEMKLTIKQLRERININKVQLTNLLIKMAAVRKVIARQPNGKLEVEKEGPYILLQQKAKHIDKKYFGIKTPVYILPFEETYYSYNK